MGVVYLLHFNKKYYHAQHYIGYTDNLEKRLKRHNDKHGSHLVAAIVKNGIGFVLARTWENVSYDFERQLKKRKNAKYLCPICKEEIKIRNAVKEIVKEFNISPMKIGKIEFKDEGDK